MHLSNLCSVTAQFSALAEQSPCTKLLNSLHESPHILFPLLVSCGVQIIYTKRVRFILVNAQFNFKSTGPVKPMKHSQTGLTAELGVVWQVLGNAFVSEKDVTLIQPSGSNNY